MTPQEALKNLEKPKGRWGTILATTPIVMTVLATVFAGLSSSEMTQAMFHRSLASQQQSKAGDQWAFFQAKKVRGTTLEANIELLQSLGHAEPLNAQQLSAALNKLSASIAASSYSAAEKEAAQAKLKPVQEQLALLLAPDLEKHWVMIQGGELPLVEVAKLPNSEDQTHLNAALDAIKKKKPEEEIYPLIKLLSPALLEAAIRQADNAAIQFDRVNEPTIDFARKLSAWLAQADGAIHSLEATLPPAASERRQPLNQFRRQVAGGRAAVNDYTARRYRQESFYNGKIAELYEARVWRSGMESDRHRNRSQLFFYSMLVAQIGVTISSLALAQAKRSGLWFVAALAGLAALGFSAWVYLSW